MAKKYLDMYEGVHADVVYSNRFDGNSDLRTTFYLKSKTLHGLPKFASNTQRI